jgi:hypothetical protein
MSDAGSRSGKCQFANKKYRRPALKNILSPPFKVRLPHHEAQLHQDRQGQLLVQDRRLVAGVLQPQEVLDHHGPDLVRNRGRDHQDPKALVQPDLDPGHLDQKDQNPDHLQDRDPDRPKSDQNQDLLSSPYRDHLQQVRQGPNPEV